MFIEISWKCFGSIITEITHPSYERKRFLWMCTTRCLWRCDPGWTLGALLAPVGCVKSIALIHTHMTFIIWLSRPEQKSSLPVNTWLGEWRSMSCLSLYNPLFVTSNNWRWVLNQKTSQKQSDYNNDTDVSGSLFQPLCWKMSQMSQNNGKLCQNNVSQ